MSSQCSATGKSQHLLVEVVLFLLGLISVAQQAAAFTVYVSNTEGFVSVIDSTTNAIRATIPAGGTGITISPDGRSAWVGDVGIDADIAVINTKTNAISGKFSPGVRPLDTAFTPNGKTAYVTDFLVGSGL